MPAGTTTAGMSNGRHGAENPSPPAHAPAGGTLVVVVGPSGAGKDTLINGARAQLADDPRIRFVRRVITREAGGGEPHDTLDRAAFEKAREAGAFALWWEANGLLYGVPADIRHDLACGLRVVVNGSREQIGAFRALFPGCCIVLVTARPETLAARLAARGRETAEQQGERLRRAAEREGHVNADRVISNDDAPETAIAAFVALLAQDVLDGGHADRADQEPPA